MALVSIIIPCYKQAHYLAQAIDSAIAQTYPHVEILVIDDGSPDHTRDVAQSYSQVRYIRQENAGVAAARNTGISAARGEYLQFLDADDVLLPTKIAQCMTEFAAQPELNVVYTDYEVRDESLSTPLNVSWGHSQPESELHTYVLMHSSPIAISAAVFRREVLEHMGGFNTQLHGTEDWLMWFTLVMNRAKFRFVNEKLAWYRRYTTSTSSNLASVAVQKIRAWEIARTLPIGTKLDFDFYIGMTHRTFAKQFWRTGDGVAARRHYREAIRYHKQDRVRLLIVLALTYMLRTRGQ
jgi:glycosyltransferase involved in cell wall biosynthesis